jgi:hypothetical protein
LAVTLADGTAAPAMLGGVAYRQQLIDVEEKMQRHGRSSSWGSGEGKGLCFSTKYSGNKAAPIGAHGHAGGVALGDHDIW